MNNRRTVHTDIPAPVIVVHLPTAEELAGRTAVFEAFLAANPFDPYTGERIDVAAWRRA